MRAAAWTALALAVAPVPAPALAGATEATPPPAYQKVRYDEDYSYLKDPSRRTDFWDPIKYIPLNSAGDAYLSFGGEGRWRYERYHDYQWNPDSPDDDGYFLQRYLLHGDLHLGAAFRVFAQLQSSLEDRRAGGPRPTDEDRLDLHQLFGEARLALASSGGAVTLRVGRQEMLYGTQRLVSVRESPNLRRAFDAARILTRFGAWRVDGFFARPVDEDRGEFDDWESIDGNDFWGVYATRAARDGPGLDLYYLGLLTPDAEFAQGSGNAKRHSLGARLFGECAGWDYNFEGVYQFGRFAHDDILAWTLASDTGYTFSSIPFAPRLGLKADVISGDTDANDGKLGTFDPLFPRGAYFGEASLIWPANLLDVDPEIAVQLVKGIDLRADWDVFWRYSTDDGLYTNGFNLARPPDGGARFIGHQLNVTVEWRPERHVTVDIAYSHFFAGAFIRESGPDADVDFVGAWLIYRF